MSDRLRLATVELEFKGQDGVTGVKQFGTAVKDTDKLVKNLSAALGDNTTVAVKNFRTSKELTSEARKIASQMARTERKVESLTEYYKFQSMAVNQVSERQEVLNALYKLGSGATLTQKKEVVKLVREYQRLRVATSKNAQGFRNLHGVTQNLGWQLQDVAVQSQMGTAGLTIFAQQGSQMASAFGPGGAILGAVIAVGATIASVGAAASKTAEELFDMSKAEIKTADKVNELYEKGEQLTKSQIKLMEAQRDALIDKLKAEQELLTLSEKQLRVEESKEVQRAMSARHSKLSRDDRYAILTASIEAKEAAEKQVENDKKSTDENAKKVFDSERLLQIKAKITKLESTDYGTPKPDEKKKLSDLEKLIQGYEKQANAIGKGAKQLAIEEARSLGATLTEKKRIATAFIAINADKEKLRIAKETEAYRKREATRDKLARSHDPRPGYGAEDAKFIANMKMLAKQKADIKDDEFNELTRINSLVEAETERHIEAIEELNFKSFQASVATMGMASTQITSLADMMTDGVDQVREQTEEMSAFQKAAFLLSQGVAAAQAYIDGVSLGSKLAAQFASTPAGVSAMQAYGSAIGAANAGAIMGATFAGTFDKGGRIPDNQIGIVSEYGDELINGQLVKGPANVTSREDTEKLMNGGSNNLKIVVENKIAGAEYSVEQMDGNTVKIIAERVFDEKIDKGVSGVLSNRNSKGTKALKQNFTARSAY